MKLSQLLSDKSKWTKGCSARNENNQPVHLYSPDATCWCLAGAVFKVTGKPVPPRSPTEGCDVLQLDDRTYLEYSEKITKALRQLFKDDPERGDHIAKGRWICFNDHEKTTFEEIQKLIAAAEATE